MYNSTPDWRQRSSTSGFNKIHPLSLVTGIAVWAGNFHKMFKPFHTVCSSLGKSILLHSTLSTSIETMTGASDVWWKELEEWKKSNCCCGQSFCLLCQIVWVHVTHFQRCQQSGDKTTAVSLMVFPRPGISWDTVISVSKKKVWILVYHLNHSATHF